MNKKHIQHWRSITQIGFFTLFIIAPPLNIFRYDLTLGHFILFGHSWTLQLNTLPGNHASLNVLIYGLLPVVSIAAIFLFIAWRWGRVYCGWFCPHFSVVELINKLMIRSFGKASIWDKNTLPEKQANGAYLKPNKQFLLPTLLAVLFFALLWSISLLSYLLPPFEIYSHIIHGELTPNQATFIGVATLAFCVEFLFARHLFCRFGCAVGLFQSLAWMANRKAMVVAFDTPRAQACKSCNNACDNACPMRLQPRTLKRKMFSCTECGQCISACTEVQTFNKEESLLHWTQGDEAMKISQPPVSGPTVNAIIRER